MFNNKKYYVVNREERFYCALVAHALLHSKHTYQKFRNLINNKLQIQLDQLDYEIYLEIAALRDYWNDLGNPRSYSPETHDRRINVLKEILRSQFISDTIIDEFDLFWTKEDHKKLWCPGHWSNERIKSTGDERFQKIKWAFNAKPDIMIISGSYCLLIEAKVESGIGQYGGNGNDQLATQELISKLLKLLVPEFKEKVFKNILLTISGKDGLSWEEIIDVIDETEIDGFTWKCLIKLKNLRRINNIYELD